MPPRRSLAVAVARQAVDYSPGKVIPGRGPGTAQVHALRDTLRPYLLRRLKEDVEKSIPPKEEVIVEARHPPPASPPLRPPPPVRLAEHISRSVSAPVPCPCRPSQLAGHCMPFRGRLRPGHTPRLRDFGFPFRFARGVRLASRVLRAPRLLPAPARTRCAIRQRRRGALGLPGRAAAARRRRPEAEYRRPQWGDSTKLLRVGGCEKREGLRSFVYTKHPFRPRVDRGGPIRVSF